MFRCKAASETSCLPSCILHCCCKIYWLPEWYMNEWTERAWHHPPKVWVLRMHLYLRVELSQCGLAAGTVRRNDGTLRRSVQSRPAPLARPPSHTRACCRHLRHKLAPDERKPCLLLSTAAATTLRDACLSTSSLLHSTGEKETATHYRSLSGLPFLLHRNQQSYVHTVFMC
jgi:hypothetical protein